VFLFVAINMSLRRSEEIIEERACVVVCGYKHVAPPERRTLSRSVCVLVSGINMSLRRSEEIIEERACVLVSGYKHVAPPERRT